MIKKLRWILATLCILLLGTVGYYGYAFYQFGMNIQENDSDSPFRQFEHAADPPNHRQTGEPSVQESDPDLYIPPKWEGKERVNILLLGGDSRGLRPNDAPRSDSILVGSIDPLTKQVTLFSIMRDTYVDIPGRGKDRINAALHYGGPRLAMETVSTLLDIPIQYYVYTDFKGFIALVDAVGGIDIEIEKDMVYRDSRDSPEYQIHLKKGYQHVNGNEALQYVRFRHDALSDFARTERQRKFLKALAVKMQSTTSLIKLPKILSSIDPYIKTNMSVAEMLKLGALGFDLKTASMDTLQLPPSNLLEERNIRGAAVLTADPRKLRGYVREQLESKPDPAPAASGGDPDNGPSSSPQLQR